MRPINTVDCIDASRRELIRVSCRNVILASCLAIRLRYLIFISPSRGCAIIFLGRFSAAKRRCLKLTLSKLKTRAVLLVLSDWSGLQRTSRNDSRDIMVLNNNAFCGNLAGYRFLSINKPRGIRGNAAVVQTVLLNDSFIPLRRQPVKRRINIFLISRFLSVFYFTSKIQFV